MLPDLLAGQCRRRATRDGETWQKGKRRTEVVGGFREEGACHNNLFVCYWESSLDEKGTFCTLSVFLICLPL